MTSSIIFPAPKTFQVQSWKLDDKQLKVTLQSLSPEAHCPLCQQRSSRIQSRYQRTLADLPWCGWSVQLTVQVRRFFCDRHDCRRRIFVERIEALASAYARRTQRVQQLVWQLGYALGGEAAVRIAQHLAILLSASTLLRQLRRLSQTNQLPASVPATHIGIDDWAFRRGHQYGTIIVDLQQQCPIDLLSNREADTVVAWLKAHPEVKLISRDRSGSYADAARRGAPQAVQVADRWHLLKNLREVLERLLHRYSVQIKAVADQQAPRPSASPASIDVTPECAVQHVSRTTAQVQRAHRHQQVHDLRQQGWPLLTIARQLRMNRATVRRYLKTTCYPPRAARPKGKRQIDPFLAYLQQRWEAGCQNARVLHQELQVQGFCGAYAAVKRAVKPWRTRCAQNQPANLNLPSARQVSWWLVNLKPPAKQPLTAEQRDQRQYQRRFVATLGQHCPAIKRAQRLANQFIAYVRKRQVEHFEEWLTAARNSQITELMNFATGLLSDKAAVRAALSEPWSNGQTEGQINRLKCIKRQMYGRANLDLLRIRVLPPLKFTTAP